MNKYIGLELISACNLTCKMCACRHHFTGEKLPDDHVYRVFNDISRYNSITASANKVTVVRFDGNNEALIVDNIAELIIESKKINPDVLTYVVTNGLLLDEVMSESLISAGLDKLHVSITGTTPEVYRSFQGWNLREDRLNEVFATVTQNTLNFLETASGLQNKPEVVLSFIVSKDSVSDVINYKKFWSDKGAKLDIRRMGSDKIVNTSKPLSEIKAFRKCSFVGHMLIKANGDVLLACCTHTVPIIGNIYDKSLFEILTSKEFLDLEAAYDNLDIKNLPEICTNCSNMHVYEPASSVSEENSALNEKCEDSFDNCDFKNNNLHEFYRQIVGRQLFVFGAGRMLFDVLPRLDKRVCISGIVDNDTSKHGMSVNGIIVEPVETLKSGDADDRVVLISMMAMNEAEEQLRALGIKRYFSSVLFPGFADVY